uniref:NADH-ubiquinone oxidoreductase chain 2 n=1 Tax=Diadromus collaris TaxID=7421 RepID=U5HTE4_9HYME|nr:NADH dehydrogenase subunit 2 [Diadromus collaris]
MFMKIYIFPIILLSPVIMMSCNSWFSIWMVMELNLMSFIPFIIFFNKFFKELSIKYFIVQAFSSSLLIISSNLMFMNFFNIKILMILLINLSLFMKIGSPPFHNWFINMMNNMNWMNCLMLSTWQKIIPMISIMYMINKNLIYLMTIFSSIIGSIMALNHQSIRIILSYSSINHMSWMFMNLLINELIWMYYFLSYLLINMSIMIILNKFNLFYINQFYSINMLIKNKFFILLNFFSISSLPPMFGFTMKWISLYFFNINFIQIILMLMILMSIFSFMYYMRIYINIILNFKLLNKLILINKFIYFNYSNNLIIMFSFINMWMMSLWMF